MRLLILDTRSDTAVEHVGVLPLVLGRREAPGTYVLADGEVSRRHVALEFAHGEVVVTDLGSANGTFVNGARVRTASLTPADVLRVGAFELRWSAAPRRRDALTALAPSAETRAVRLADLLPEAPARRVVRAAEAHNRARGHELDGFLSAEFGFLPAAPPLTALPDSHRAWDDLVPRLPELFRSLTLRPALEALPLLDAGPAALPDRYLLRASTMLGAFAHAYQYVTTEPPTALPEAVLRPWREVSRRLGKPLPAVSYIDLFFYNWRLRDPAGPRALDNMDLLVPAWDNGAERIFYLVTAEFAMALTPVLGAMLDAQEAVLADDRLRLEAALLLILDRFQHVTQTIYPQIDPNPRSVHHLDQVLWAKTVGTAGVPVFEGAPSPSGTAQPHIHAIDAFLERKDYGSLVGRQSVYLAGHFPRHWSELVAALREVSVRQYVEDVGDSGLRGLYNAVLDAYVGDRGWMGLHRIKAYGFLEVAFKVGRQVTTGARFTGLFKERTWDAVDEELALVRDERRPPVGAPVAFGRPRSGSLVTAGETWTCHVELDVTGEGVHHLPGDRVGVLVENGDEIVARTLRALRATGDEIVTLTPQWREAVALRAGVSPDTAALPLRTVLTFARIRPMTREMAGRLLALSATSALRRIVDARMEDQWELWDVLGLLHAAGHDVTRLWKAGADEPDALCRVVAPETFRLYSIASATAPGRPAETLRLVVGGLAYTSARTSWSYAQQRHGTASHFLRRVATDARFRGKRLSLRVVAAPRFRLPTAPGVPVVMFAAGSGIAPFHGFAQARTTAGETGDRLYLAARTPEEFAHREDFAHAAAEVGLVLRAAFSQVDAQLRFAREEGRFVVEPGRRARVDALVARDAAELWELLRSRTDGGRGGVFYVCGSTRFASSVITALTGVVRGHTGSDAAAAEVVRGLVAEGRLMLDVFTTYGGHAQQGTRYDVSELLLHTTPEAGMWMAVSGKVYDVTEFLHLHVGGPHIVRNHVGLDATGAYRRVLHHAHSEIDSQLGMYEIGAMRRLHLGGRWGVVLTPEGLRYLSLEDLFTTWVRAAYLLVGMGNALVGDYGFLDSVATRGEDPGELTPFKAQYLVEAHRRFLVSYLDGLLAEDLPQLWLRTVGFCAPDLDVRTLDTELAALAATPEHLLVRNSVLHLKGLLQQPGGGPGFATVQALCRVYAREDVRLLRELTLALREGIRAFEEHEADVVDAAADRLMAALRAAPAAVGDYQRRVAAATVALGITADLLPAVLVEPPIPDDGGIPGHGGTI